MYGTTLIALPAYIYIQRQSVKICSVLYLFFYMNIQKTNGFVNAQAHFWMTDRRGRKDT